MMINTYTRTVGGHKYRDVEIIDSEGYPIDILQGVLTPHCGWTAVHICSRACDVNCKNAQELFDEVGIEY